MIIITFLLQKAYLDNDFNELIFTREKRTKIIDL